MIDAVLVGIVTAGFGYLIKTTTDLKVRVMRVELIQRLQLKKNGVDDGEIDIEIINNGGKT